MKRVTSLLGSFPVCAVLIVAFVFCLVSAQSVQAQQQTIVGPQVKSPGAKSQPCGADSCADRADLVVKLPAGATYVGTHYFTNAGFPNDYGDVRETGLTEVSYAHFSVATHAKNSTNEEVVTVYYYNRSNRDRIVSINVDYMP